MLLMFSLVCGCALLQLAQGAGMTSHNVFAHRTSQFEYFGPASADFHPADFYGLAVDRLDAVQAGAPFPDYLYLCGDEHDAGEEAHWTPFQLAAVDYIRDKYPNWALEGRDGPGAGLVAFMMGVTSHYITDINWHGLQQIPAGQGIIRTMGYADFNCTDGELCSVAHTAADTGGEFAAAASMDISWFPADQWYIPVDDLVNIYAIMNSTGEGPMVEARWIMDCGAVFYLGSWATATFGALVYPLMAPQLGALLLEDYNSFPVGGVGDDAAWTGFMWNRLAGWLADGTPETPPVNVASTEETRPHVSKRPKSHVLRRKYVQALLGVLRANSSSIVGDLDASGGAHFNFGKGASVPRELLHKVADSFLDGYVRSLLDDIGEELETKLASVKAAAHLRVDNMHNEDTKLPAELTEDSVLGVGSAPREFFGASLTTAVLHHSAGQHDGEDILVGSPGAGRTGGPQEGLATLYFADGATKPVVFRGGRGGAGGHHVEAMPSYERFGWVSAACDVNADGHADAVICAPSFGGGRDIVEAKGNYSGRCDVFYGPFNGPVPVAGVVPDVSIYGDKVWGNFGHSIAVGDVDGDGGDDIVIGAPYAGRLVWFLIYACLCGCNIAHLCVFSGDFRCCSYEDVAANSLGEISYQGAAFVFLSSSFADSLASGMARVNASVAADFVLQQPSSYQWFGKSLSVLAPCEENQLTHPLLLVGAPSFHSEAAADSLSAVGRLYAYGFADGAATVQWSITGGSHAGRTGHSIAVSGSVIAMSQPAFNTTKSQFMTGAVPPAVALAEEVGSMRNGEVLRAGRVLLLSVPDLTLAAGTKGPELTVDDVAFVELTGNSFEGRFGATLGFAGGLRDEHVRLVIGEPLADYGAGAVHVFAVSTKGAITADHSRSEKGSRWLGDGSKGRFGSSIAVRGDQLITSAPYAAPVAVEGSDTAGSAEEVGAVFLTSVLP